MGGHKKNSAVKGKGKGKSKGRGKGKSGNNSKGDGNSKTASPEKKNRSWREEVVHDTAAATNASADYQQNKDAQQPSTGLPEKLSSAEQEPRKQTAKSNGDSGCVSASASEHPGEQWLELNGRRLSDEEIGRMLQPHRRSRPHKVGLTNHGNTCYMNSALQALMHCNPIQDFFHTCQGHVWLSLGPSGKSNLAHQFLQLVQKVAAADSEQDASGSSKFVSPSSFVRYVRSNNLLFQGYSQQVRLCVCTCVCVCVHVCVYMCVSGVRKKWFEPQSSHAYCMAHGPFLRALIVSRPV